MPTKKVKQPLSVTHPELAKEADGWDTTAVTYGNSRRAKWKCALGHKWEARIGSRTFNNSGCPYCSGVKILKGFNDLETLFPELAREAVGWNPSDYGRASKSKVEWRCDRNHFYFASISDRAIKKSGCPYCSGNSVLAGFNDLATLFPDLAVQADGWDPTKVSSGSGKSVSWICELRHRWNASPQSRALHETGCPYCSGNKVLSGFNDLKSTHPVIAAQAVGWDPGTVTFGNRSIREWRCQYGHIYKTSPNTRTSRGEMDGCPYCHGTKVLVGFNDLFTTFPGLAEQADGWDPLKYTSGSSTKLWWKCLEGHRWKTSPNSRSANGTGCPSCANSGFDPNKSGYLYFLRHPEWEMLQIGITNVPDDRLRSHKRLSWELLEIRGPMDGHLTQQWETAILQMLKAKGADLSNDKTAGKFDGYSEAWSTATFEVSSIKELMRLTEEFEENAQ